MDILSNNQSHSLPDKMLVDKGITKGKILRVKPGYNPNSSSMGSIVFSFPQIMMGVTAIFGAVSGIIISRFMKNQPPMKQDVIDNEIEK
jgi:hypothetical protein